MSSRFNDETSQTTISDRKCAKAALTLVHSAPELTGAEMIEDYLDHLCAPLVGIVPYRERFRLREETGFHLEERINGYLLQGLSDRAAMLEAFRRVGTSEEVSRTFLESWFKHQPQGPLAKVFGLANSYALVPFAVATMLVTWLLALRVLLLPNPEPFMFGLSLAHIRHIIPEPLPLPEKNWQSVLLYIVAVLAPFVAGWSTGIRATVSPARAVCNVQVCFTLYTFTFSTLVVPSPEGIFLTLFMLLFWVPVGCITAHIAAIITWQQRSRRFVVQTCNQGP